MPCTKALNRRNERFFEACDGIFLNYVWTPDLLAGSAATATQSLTSSSSSSSSSRRWDVYAGIDVFGRNTYGGGGYSCDKALEAIRQAGLSAAIFAPGW